MWQVGKVVIAGAFSGTGFKHMALVGMLVTDMIRGTNDTLGKIDMTPFKLGEIDTGRWNR